VNAVQTTDRHQLNLAFTSLLTQTYSSSTEITNANAIRSIARYEFNLAQRTFGFGLAQLESDQLQNLDLRTVVGGGVGYRFAQYKATAFDVFSGLSFNQESFSNEADRNSGEILTGEELTYRISDRTSFTERCVVFPNFTNRGEFRVNLDSSAPKQPLGRHPTTSSATAIKYTSAPARRC
jgi:putative salt-induced outer membrane protein